MEKKVILDIKNLRTTFDTHDGLVHAVNGISYQLHEGESLGIVGESGCGKSVSMLSVMKLLPEPPANIQADYIQFHDTDLSKLSFLSFIGSFSLSIITLNPNEFE